MTVFSSSTYDIVLSKFKIFKSLMRFSLHFYRTFQCKTNFRVPKTSLKFAIGAKEGLFIAEVFQYFWQMTKMQVMNEVLRQFIY